METARDLSLRLQALLRCEHGALAEFVVALADFDRRRLWAELGHASLFVFLHRDLGLSKGAAFYRATAAGLVQRCPEVVEPLREGKLCLTTVVEVARILTPENAREVLPRFFGLSRREAQEVVVELQPREAPPLRDIVTVARRDASPPSLRLAPPVHADFGQRLASQPRARTRTPSRQTRRSPRPDLSPVRRTRGRRRSSPSPPSCPGSTSRCRGGSWTRQRPPAPRSRTRTPAPVSRRSSRQGSTCCSSGRRGGTGS